VVDGVGAIVALLPPVAVVYHAKLVPIAVNALAVASWQYEGEVAVGAAGCVLTVTVISVLGLSQPLFWLT
jgi:hypothetical protein